MSNGGNKQSTWESFQCGDNSYPFHSDWSPVNNSIGIFGHRPLSTQSITDVLEFFWYLFTSSWTSWIITIINLEFYWKWENNEVQLPSYLVGIQRVLFVCCSPFCWQGLHSPTVYWFGPLAVDHNQRLPFIYLIVHANFPSIVIQGQLSPITIILLWIFGSSISVLLQPIYSKTSFVRQFNLWDPVKAFPSRY